MFFYYLFKTQQISPRLCALCFFFTGVVSISILLLIQRIPPWTILFALARSRSLIPQYCGMLLGVGVHEELCKAAILFWLVKRRGQLLIPQTVVFYGMMSGLGFGIYEGVNYQMHLNREQGVDQAYLLNIARLTSLPFLHAVWTGLAGYFISFAALYPKKRFGLMDFGYRRSSDFSRHLQHVWLGTPSSLSDLGNAILSGRLNRRAAGASEAHGHPLCFD